MATTVIVKMKLFPVLAVLAAALLAVHADFYINLFYEPTQKYLSAINYGGPGGQVYLKAAKSSPDYFTKVKFVTSELPCRRAAIQNHPGTYYFCRDPNSNNYIKELERDIENNTILLGSDIHNYSIALKANNGKNWDLGGSDGKFIRATGRSPVYFDVLQPNSAK